MIKTNFIKLMESLDALYPEQPGKIIDGINIETEDDSEAPIEINEAVDNKAMLDYDFNIFAGESEGAIIPVTIELNTYISDDDDSIGNLAIELIAHDEDFPEPFGSLTVNLPDMQLDPEYAFVDVNNMSGAEKFIKKYKLGKPTGQYSRSGFVTYPLYKFDLAKLKKLAGEPITEEMTTDAVKASPEFLTEFGFNEGLSDLENHGYSIINQPDITVNTDNEVEITFEVECPDIPLDWTIIEDDKVNEDQIKNLIIEDIEQAFNFEAGNTTWVATVNPDDIEIDTEDVNITHEDAYQDSNGQWMPAESEIEGSIRILPVVVRVTKTTE